MYYLKRLADVFLAAAMLVMAPFAAIVARLGGRAPLSRSVLEHFGIGMVRHHYYTPLVFPKDIARDLSLPRQISGLNLNEDGQLRLVRQFRYREELEAIPLTPCNGSFGYHNSFFGPGDAEFLYNMVRHFKPRRIIEIGGGHSTLMAEMAIKANKREDRAYSCVHTCVEPFQNQWLDSLGIQVIRKKVEACAAATFADLGENDILLIDSTHIIRPQGDVLHEYLHILGSLNRGVLIHAHDIFTPSDYPSHFVLEERWMWNEQYLLEAFLCFNQAFEVIAAVNWLAKNHSDVLSDACPMLLKEAHREPGSFWLRRV